MSGSIETVLLLLVEDNLGDARLLREMLKENDLHPTVLTHVETPGAAELHLAEKKPAAPDWPAPVVIPAQAEIQ